MAPLLPQMLDFVHNLYMHNNLSKASNISQTVKKGLCYVPDSIDEGCFSNCQLCMTIRAKQYEKVLT